MNMDRWRLQVIVFFSGACVMALELLGSRILAPYVGTSTPVWTALIGIILAALSLGYWWGGRLADRVPTVRTLAALLAAAGLCVLTTWAFQEFILQVLS